MRLGAEKTDQTTTTGTGATADPPKRKGPLSFVPLLTRGKTTVEALELEAARAPDNAGVFERLGIALARAREHGRAIDAFQRTVVLDPKRVQAWSALGEAWVHVAGTHEVPLPGEARSAFGQALALDPLNVRAQFYMALDKDVQGARKEAIDDWLGLLRVVRVGSGNDLAIRSAILSSLQREMAIGQ